MTNLKSIVVFDCETKTPIIRGAGFGNLEVSVAVAYRYDRQDFLVFLEDEVGKLCDLVSQADLVVGFNQLGFDLPLLRNYKRDLPIDPNKNFDILREFEKAEGFRIKLDHLLGQTLGTQKAAHGLQAVEWYKQGEIQKIVDYCREDVRQTRMLFDYVLEHQSVAYLDRQGKKKWVKIQPPEIRRIKKGENLNLF